MKILDSSIQAASATQATLHKGYLKAVSASVGWVGAQRKPNITKQDGFHDCWVTALKRPNPTLYCSVLLSQLLSIGVADAEPTLDLPKIETQISHRHAILHLAKIEQYLRPGFARACIYKVDFANHEGKNVKLVFSIF